MEIIKKIKDKLIGVTNANNTLYVGKQASMLWSDETAKTIFYGSPIKVGEEIGDIQSNLIRRIVLSPEYYELHMLDELPEVPAEEVDEALKWHMADLLHKDGTNLLVRHFSCFDDSDQSVNKYYAAVAEYSDIQTITEGIRADHLESIAINELSINDWQSQQDGEGDSTIIIAIEESNVNLYFFVRNCFIFKRQILGHDPNQLIDSIQRTMEFCSSNFKAPSVSRVFVTQHEFCKTLSKSLDAKATYYFVNTFQNADEQTPERAIALAAYHPLSVEVNEI